MALSMKNSLVSLTLSGTMLFAGFLTSETPIDAGKSTAGVSVSRQETARIVPKTPTGDSLKKNKRSFAAPYFSFGNAGISQGANQ